MSGANSDLYNFVFSLFLYLSPSLPCSLTPKFYILFREFKFFATKLTFHLTFLYSTELCTSFMLRIFLLVKKSQLNNNYSSGYYVNDGTVAIEATTKTVLTSAMHY